MRAPVVTTAILLCLSACGSSNASPQRDADTGADRDGPIGEQDAGTPRPFAMGFTPFPHEVSEAAVDFAYEKLASDGDLYALHSTEGVPWVEALQGAEVDGYGAALRGKWYRQREEARAHPDHLVYLGLTPLDDSRSRLADYWASEEHLALPGEWGTYSFDSPEVKAAYLSYCRRAIAYFKPAFLAIGLEVNLLKQNSPAAWTAYSTLQRETYLALKQENPDLPIFVTFTAVDLLDGWTDLDHSAQLAALADALPYSDYLGLSFYPYLSKYLTEPIPSTAFEELAKLAGDKPMAIAESGFPAQITELPTAKLTFGGTHEKQDAWIATLLSEASMRGMPFIVNFVIRDYDALWQTAGRGDVLAIWRDTGLYDEAGLERPAWMRWKSALKRPRSPLRRP